MTVNIKEITVLKLEFLGQADIFLKKETGFGYVIWFLDTILYLLL